MVEISEVTARLLDYVLYNTRSEDDRESIPNTKKQLELVHKLAGELKELGTSQVRISEQGYVYACIPTNLKEGKTCPSLGPTAHIDTAPSFSSKDVRPQFVRDYDGQDICPSREQDPWVGAADFPDSKAYEDKALTTTGETVLLGADNEAGITGVMTVAAYLLGHPEVKHGIICIGFTPDEEVGRGANDFDMDGSGADMAYTADGGALGEPKYGNFNAASGRVVVHGANIHPDTAKERVRNAPLMAMEFQSLFPANENPMYTERYEGFYHLGRVIGCVEEIRMDYIIRNHDRTKSERRRELFSQAAGFLSQKYGSGTVEAVMKDSYYNVKKKIGPHMNLVDKVKVSMEKLGIQPIVVPIRGGADGARLSYTRLSCLNLCTGDHNFYGKYESTPVQSTEKITELPIEIIRSFVEAWRWFVLS